MKGLIVAIQFLTRLPTPRIVVTDEAFARSMRWFPAVGLIVGVVVAGGAWIGAGIDPWVGALFGLLLWIGVTGALHLDGLGDIADARGAAHKVRENLHAVLADPHVGSFAVVAIGLQLLAKLVLLHTVIDRRLWAGLALVPFAARIGPLLWTRCLRPLHPGLAERFRNAVDPGTLILWLLLLLAAAWLVPGLLTAPLLLLFWQGWLRRTLGGISGDGHGAGIELVETVLLIALLAAERIG